jgi:DNA-binding transcriptional MerR regulator
MRYRVDELAAREGVSVDTVRFYQAKGLLEPPEREGRVAYYSEGHLRNLLRIRDLKAKGFTLVSIRRLLSGELDAADEALVAALAAPPSRPESEERLTLEQLAARTGVSAALLAAIEADGLLSAEAADGEPTYSAADAAAIEAGLVLLEAGLPLSELLELARAYDRAVGPVVERSVELFDSHVRRRMRTSEASGEEAARRLVAAFERTFAATTALVAHRFGRLLLERAQRRVEEAAGKEPEEGANGLWRA